MEIQALNMSFKNQQDLKLFFNITKKEKLITKWLLQEIDNLEKANQEELKKKLFDSFDNDDFILFIFWNLKIIIIKSTYQKNYLIY